MAKSKTKWANESMYQTYWFRILPNIPLLTLHREVYVLGQHG
jgi:hypothetical protein